MSIVTHLPTGLHPPQASALATALRLARNGIPVFPCRPDKTPYTNKGFHDATTDAGIIRHWWQRWPDALVGMPTGQTSGRVILDCDNKTGEHEGQRSLDALIAECGDLPDTPRAITPTKGTHYVFTAPAGTRIPTTAGKLAAGLDVRGDGGYAIVPGSKGYEWDAGAHPQEVKLAPIPDWLLRKMLEGSSSTRTTHAETGDTVPQGGRNAYLTSVGGGVRRAGCDEDEVYAVLELRNARVCKPPLPDAEVRAIARSVARYEPSEVPRVPALTQAEQQLRAVQRIQSTTARALAHPRARKLVPVVTRFATAIAEQKRRGEPAATPDGLRHVSKAGMGGRQYGTDDWDIKESTVKNHLEELRAFAPHIPGFRAEKRPVNFPKRQEDPDTGEVTMVDDYRETWVYDFEGDAADLLEILPSLPYPEDMRGKCRKCGHDMKHKTVEYCPNCEVVQVLPKPTEGVGQSLPHPPAEPVENPAEGVGHALPPIGNSGPSIGGSTYPTQPTLEDWERIYSRGRANTPPLQPARTVFLHEAPNIGEANDLIALARQAEASGDKAAAEELWAQAGRLL